LKKCVLGVILTSLTLLAFASDIELLTQKANKGDAQSAYELATYYEAQNDKENAFAWYKKAATLSLTSKTIEATSTGGILENKLRKVEQTQAIYGKLLEPYADKETENTVRQMMTKVFDISPYKINYLLPITYDDSKHENRKPQETKFQVSFQKALSDNFFGFNETFSAGYTQTSWWQTSTDSTPFRETNYQPELFVIVPYFDKYSALKSYQLGLLHESNGRSGLESRSWNRLYAKAFFQLDGGLFLSPRIWYRIHEDSQTDDNPNIDDYLGYGDLELMYPWKKHTFKLLVRNNLHFDNTNKGALQFDWTFPLWEQNLFGYFQLYSGYSESLIDYDKRTDRIGVGFALSR
jgi:phospholipase A1/A2